MLAGLNEEHQATDNMKEPKSMLVTPEQTNENNSASTTHKNI
jgi:hypothetical protein